MLSDFSLGPILAELERVRHDMDQFFEGAVGHQNLRTSMPHFPSMAIAETPTDFRFVAFAPGLKPETLEITVQGRTLRIEGEREGPADYLRRMSTGLVEHAKCDCQRSERPWGHFTRVLSVPDVADPQRVEALYRNGILTVVMDKVQEQKPRRIDIH